jgi:hypothetical protein
VDFLGAKQSREHPVAKEKSARFLAQNSTFEQEILQNC